MAENKSNTRAKKTLQSSKDFAKSTRDTVAKEKDKILEIIKNNIVDRRIEEKEAKLRALAELYEENEVNAIAALKSAEDLEKKKLSEDYESIVKKQLQILQADERGKQALLNEISEIKQQQRKRSEALQARKKALLIEKERSKRIAALPPPLPRSVKLLLKEQEKKDSEAPTLSNSFHEELYPVEEEFEDFEDKENMDDETYHQQRRQMQEEWDRKAKKRFNEAIKKDRQKQEHAQILKEIENAEKISRRQMAKNLSEPCGKVPCTLSDRLNHIEKQAVLEDAVENVYKKSSTTKEHVIEDLEGYEDQWEARYKRIDSNLEEKLINCVPNFVKQNYSYLLEEEPPQQCGNRFARLDESSDELNMAYIESPTEQINSSDRISAVISHLDQMNAESNEVYEKEFKPLLEAENLKGSLPKTESFDKAVEANILKPPTEDKAIDAREEVRNVVPSTSRSTQADFMKSGVMAFKRRSLGSRNKSYLGNLSDPKSQTPSWVEPETTHPNGSWSSSSYLSLPSRHGQPDICKLCDSPSCRLPLVEDKGLHSGSRLPHGEDKDLHRDCIPLAKGHGQSPEEVSRSDYRLPLVEDKILHRDSRLPLEEDKDLHRDCIPLAKSHLEEDVSDEDSSDVKSRVLSYVQLVAEKYLKKTPVEGEVIAPWEDEARLGDMETPERVISGDLGESSESDLKGSISSKSAAIKQSTSEKVLQKSTTQKMELPQIPPYSGKKSETGEEKPKDEFVKRCHEILNEKLSDIFSGEDGAESEVLSALKSAINEEVSEDRKRKLAPGEFVYHELSTILEMDSALTNDMPSLQDASKRTNASGSSSVSSLSRKSDEFISSEEVSTASVSLVDVPKSEASELAKNIRFIAASPKKLSDSVAQLSEPKTPLGLISGMLSEIQTPSPRGVSKAQESSSRVKTIPESSVKPPEPVSKVLEPTTPLGLMSGMLTNIQTPSPESVSEASRPKQVITEHLATPSQRSLADIHSNISTPSILNTKSGYSSRDLLTPTSQLSTLSKESDVSHMTPYSSSFRFANFKHQFLTSLTNDLPQYFRDVSSIKQDSGSSQGENKNKKPDDGQQTVPKTINYRVPVQQYFFPKDFDGNFGPVEKSSMSFKPMTPHSNVSSPGAMDTEHKSAGSKESNVHQKGYKLPKSPSEPPHSLGSSQGSFKPMTPRSYMSSPMEVPDSRQRLNAFTSRDLKKSSSGKSAESQRTDNSNYQAMTPHTYVSSIASQQSHKDFDSNSKKDVDHKIYSTTQRGGRNFSETENTGNDFQPMTPHSHIPDFSAERQHLNSEVNDERQGKHSASQKERRDWISSENSTTSFQPMTPHSNISTPNLPSQRHDLVSERKNSRHGTPLTSQKEDDYSADNSECGFQPMTPHSYLSTPNLPSQTQQNFDKGEKYHSQENEGRGSVATENSNGFEPMTPHSYISSPSVNTNISSEEDLRCHSSASVRLRLKISKHLVSGTTLEPSRSDSEAVSDGQNENPSFASSGSLKSLRLRFGDKAQNYMNPDSDLEDYMLGDGVHLAVTHPIKNIAHDVKSSGKGYEVANNEHKLKKVPRSDFFIPQMTPADLAIAEEARKAQQDPKLKKPAKVCSSDFFLPQLSPGDFPKRYFSHQLSDCPEVSSVGSSDLPTCTDSLASISSVTSSGGKSMANNKGQLRLEAGSGSSTPSGSETPCISVDSPNPILEALRKKYASDSSLKTLSSCSSHGTPSDISVSKVNYTSTPIKTIEEIIQETGILDEPDLTLMTTELTMKPESPQNTRHFSEKSIVRKDILSIPTATQNNTDIVEGLAKTPTAGGAASYAESPSLMSFLQHENSCFGDSKIEEISHLNHNISNEKLIYEDEFAGHQFVKNQPKYEYKKRTKRLWNNLEEVQTKKMLEERKKKSAENRLKMKAYSKVYNPSKKTPNN